MRDHNAEVTETNIQEFCEFGKYDQHVLKNA